MKFQINLGNHVFMIQGIIRRRKNTQFVEGYTNRCKDGKYIVFLDYDRIPLNWIIEELKHLQNMFRLGDFFIFQSSEESYHAVCLDKVSIHEFLSVLRNSSVDTAYMDVPLYFGKKIWTLRLTEKNKGNIRFKGKLKHYSLYNQSTAHAKILKKLFDLKIRLKFPDNENDLILARYPI